MGRIPIGTPIRGDREDHAPVTSRPPTHPTVNCSSAETDSQPPLSAKKRREIRHRPPRAAGIAPAIWFRGARWLCSLQGRIDRQVKIRGHRVECEVENALFDCPGVSGSRDRHGRRDRIGTW